MSITEAVPLVISVIALAVTAVLAVRQNALQSRMNNTPALVEVLSQFRSTELHLNFETVCNEIGSYDPQHGLIGLPIEFRRKVYDVCYFLQQVGCMIVIGLIDETAFTALFRARTVATWEAVGPFIERERQINPITGPEFMAVFETFATRARGITPDVARRILRRWLASPMRGQVNRVR
jgi:hypothetical protein